MSDRLAPTTTPDTRFFWDALREGRLLIQRCAGCATLRHPPRPMCPRCNSLDWDTIESSGRGEVYSFVLPRHPPWPWFEGTYVVALIALEEGTRIVFQSSVVLAVTAFSAAGTVAVRRRCRSAR